MPITRRTPHPPWPFETTAALEEALLQAGREWGLLRRCPGPPFFDGLSGWPARFGAMILRLVELRSPRWLEACECLEDTLAAVQERRAELLRVALGQILLELPPLPRRNSGSELALLDPGPLRAALAALPPGLWDAARREPHWPSGVRGWLEPLLPATPHRPSGPNPHRPGDALGPATRELLGRLAQALMGARRLLPIPAAWVGASCLDLRLDRLSSLGSDHLATWPGPEDFGAALGGLSAANRARVLALLPAGGAGALAAMAGQGLQQRSWAEVVKAQRRLSGWLGLVDFRLEVLGTYANLRQAGPSDRTGVRSLAKLPAQVLDQLEAMVRRYSESRTVRKGAQDPPRPPWPRISR